MPARVALQHYIQGINCSAPPVVGLDWQGAFYKVN